MTDTLPDVTAISTLSLLENNAKVEPATKLAHNAVVASADVSAIAFLVFFIVNSELIYNLLYHESPRFVNNNHFICENLRNRSHKNAEIGLGVFVMLDLF